MNFEFSLQCHMILQKSFYHDLLLKKHLSLLLILKTVVLLNIFVKTVMHFFWIFFIINRKFRWKHWFDIFCYIYKCIYCHSISLTHSCWIKSNTKKILLISNLWTAVYEFNLAGFCSRWMLLVSSQCAITVLSINCRIHMLWSDRF